MASGQPNEASIFNSARRIESAEDRSAFLAAACGDDGALRERVEKLLVAYTQESQFLEQPAPGLGKTVPADSAGENLAASMDAGLAPAFGKDAAVVIGDANHSVLRSLGNTLDEVPDVSLRESDGADEPVVRPSSPEMPNPQSDSRYRLDGEIARGGMGAILKGRDTDLGRDLAIKVLLDEHKTKPDVIQRFVEEAQIGGQLQHPGIAPVYELGQFSDKRPFFSMKLIKGETLSKLLARRDGPAEDRGRFLGIFEHVCQTMAYAHSRGVIHRDLKPTNIMIGSFAEVQVMDWGLAKVLPTGGVADERMARDTQIGKSIIQTLRSGVGSDTPGTFGSVGSETQMGSVMGTPAYMPPEQALGEIDIMDERADVFGLGAILCEILTGHPPYIGDDGMQVFRLASRGKLDACFERLAECDADAELVHVVQDCLHVELDQRPSNAGVLAERFSNYLQSVDVRLREAELDRVAQAARVVEERKRRKVTLALAASLLLIVGLGSAAWIHNERQNASYERERVERQLAAERTVRDDLHGADNLVASVSSVDIDAADLAAQESSLSAKLIDLDKALIRATQAVESAGHEEVGDQLRTAATDKFAQVGQLRSDCKSELDRVTSFRQLRDDLENIRLSLAGQESKTTVLGKNFFANEKANVQYEEAFRKAGLDLFQGEADDTQSVIQQSPVREELIASLDQWARAISSLSPNTDSDSRSASKLLNRLNIVSTTADRVDRNDWRKRVRYSLLAIARVTLAVPENDESERHITILKELALSDEARQQSPELIAWFGSVLRDVGEQGTALAMLRTAQQDTPSSFWLNFELGKSLSRLGESSQAVEYMRAALAVRPDSLEVLMNLATALREAGRLDESHQVRKVMIPRIPQGQENRYALYAIFQRIRMEGRVPSVIAAQRSYCDANPGDADALILLVRMFLPQPGNDAEILSVLQRVADLEPGDAERFTWVAHAAAEHMRSAGRFDDAIQAYQIAIQFCPPEDRSAQQQILRTYALLQRWDEAADFGSKWVYAKPDDAIRWLVLAPTLAFGSDQSKYETHCTDMLEQFKGSLNPSDISKVCKVCCLLPDVVESTRLPLAPLAEALESGTDDDGFAAWGWNTRALVALRSGRAQEALGFVLKSEQNNPSPHAHALNLALSVLAKVELGDTSGALADFGKGSRSFAALQAKSNVQPHNLLIAAIILREAKDSLERRLPEGLRSSTGNLPRMDARDRLELLVQFEVWDKAAPLACQISEKLPTGNWKSERALFLKPLVAIEPLFNAMLENSPNASDIWLSRGRQLALRNEWKAAADAYVRSTELGVTDSPVWFEAACAIRITGNEDGYRELVSRFLEQTGKQLDRYDGFVFARTIGLASQEKQRANEAVMLAQAAVDEAKQPWRLHALGLAQFRAGDYRQARRSLESSMNMNWGIGQNQAALALVSSAVQQRATAQKWLTAAKNFRQDKLDAVTNGTVNTQVIDWLALNALIAEAENTYSVIRN